MDLKLLDPLENARLQNGGVYESHWVELFLATVQSQEPQNTLTLNSLRADGVMKVSIGSKANTKNYALRIIGTMG